MIIVSQPKNSIANFDNITNIELEEYENKGWIIKCYTTDNHHINLAIYETKERAKEVLQEIINNYANSQIVKLPNMQYEKSISSKQLAKFMCYEMPEE